MEVAEQEACKNGIPDDAPRRCAPNMADYVLCLNEHNSPRKSGITSGRKKTGRTQAGLLCRHGNHSGKQWNPGWN